MNPNSFRDKVLQCFKDYYGADNYSWPRELIDNLTKFHTAELEAEIEYILNRIPLRNANHLIQDPDKIYTATRKIITDRLKQLKENK